MRKVKTIHPKVYVPLIVNIGLGLILVALDERELGIGALLAALSGFGVGYGTRSPYTVTDNEGN